MNETMRRADRQLTDDETLRLFREAEKRKGIEAILHKYSPDFIESGMKYIDRAFDKIHVLKFEMEEMTGKGRKT